MKYEIMKIGDLEGKGVEKERKKAIVIAQVN